MIFPQDVSTSPVLFTLCWWVRPGEGRSLLSFCADITSSTPRLYNSQCHQSKRDETFTQLCIKIGKFLRSSSNFEHLLLNSQKPFCVKEYLGRIRIQQFPPFVDFFPLAPVPCKQIIIVLLFWVTFQLHLSHDHSIGFDNLSYTLYPCLSLMFTYSNALDKRKLAQTKPKLVNYTENKVYFVLQKIHEVITVAFWVNKPL